MQPEEALVLAPGAVGQVGALHPGAGVLVEGLLASVSVDPAAAGPPLSNREKEILRLQALGYSNREMANMLAVSLRTIEAGRARREARPRPYQTHRAGAIRIRERPRGVGLKRDQPARAWPASAILSFRALCDEGIAVDS